MLDGFGMIAALGSLYYRIGNIHKKDSMRLACQSDTFGPCLVLPVTSVLPLEQLRFNAQLGIAMFPLRRTCSTDSAVRL